MNNNPINNKQTNLLKNDIILENELTELKENQCLLIEKGYEFIDNGEYNQAFAIFKIGITMDNNDPEILNGLGISLFELGYLKKSQIILERAAILNPDDSITFANLAGVLWEMGNNDKAIYYYNKSIEIDPKIEETYFNLINLYLEIGYLYMAFITCNKLIEHFPENSDNDEMMCDILVNLGLSLA